MKLLSKGKKIFDEQSDDDIDTIEIRAGRSETIVFYIPQEYTNSSHKIRVEGSNGTFTDFLVRFSEEDVQVMIFGRNPYPKFREMKP